MSKTCLYNIFHPPLIACHNITKMLPNTLLVLVFGVVLNINMLYIRTQLFI